MGNFWNSGTDEGIEAGDEPRGPIDPAAIDECFGHYADVGPPSHRNTCVDILELCE
jgi:hypothetical protein